MAKLYEVTRRIRLENAILSAAIRLGIAPKGMHLVAVKGRTTGELRETPIDPIELDGKRWLVAPFGEVNWVRNARKAGQVRLRRGRTVEYLQVREADPGESAPVLRAYLKRGYTRDYFDAGPNSLLADFEAEAHKHPVFMVLGPTSPDR
ncbi:MAG TPA: nitroreductase/quinone reductase family protein [Anaerolineales bacterium]|nr:nitroreductase/quinone reductase family protein [Anaerolineales bacterium]